MLKVRALHRSLDGFARLEKHRHENMTTGLAVGSAQGRPMAWTMSTRLRLGVRNATRSTFGTFTPSVRQRALDIRASGASLNSPRSRSRFEAGMAR